jgi:thioesterase domain-containing protein
MVPTSSAAIATAGSSPSRWPGSSRRPGNACRASKFAWLKRLIAAFPAEDERKFRAFLLSREYLLFARASLKHHLDALRRPVPLARQPRRFARKFGRIFRKAFSLLLPHPPAPAAGGIDTTQPEAAGMDIALIYHQACMAYVPRLYRGPAHVIWPSEMLLRDPFADWGSVIPRVRLVPVPGDHFSFLQGDNLRIVSEKIRACLEEDQA